MKRKQESNVAVHWHDAQNNVTPYFFPTHFSLDARGKFPTERGSRAGISAKSSLPFHHVLGILECL
jgi:hypothetical protein